MKPNPNLDELLCSLMDGELSPRQRTEVQRMAAHDPAVARRLNQLQKSRSLLVSLPVAEAPNDMLDQIKTSLERYTLLREQPAFGRRTAGAWQLAFRRFVAAAAVIALMGVLGVVIYQIVSPVAPPPTGSVAIYSSPSVPIVSDPITPVPTLVADTGISGRLELQTAALVQIDASLERAIANSGLAGGMEPDLMDGRRVYRVVGSRENVNRLVASLGSIWPKVDRATLRVDRLEASGAPVVVEAVTAEQAVSVVAQGTTEASLEMARGYAVMNHVARNMPGGEILPLIQNDPGLIVASIPMPKETQTRPDDSTNKTLTPATEKAEVNLTIVLLRTR